MSHVRIFNPSCDLAPANLLTGLPSPLPPLSVWISTEVGIYTLCNRGGGGGEEGIGLCGENIQELYTVYLKIFRTYKIALPPQRKT